MNSVYCLHDRLDVRRGDILNGSVCLVGWLVQVCKLLLQGTEKWQCHHNQTYLSRWKNEMSQLHPIVYPWTSASVIPIDWLPTLLVCANRRCSIITPCTGEKLITSINIHKVISLNNINSWGFCNRSFNVNHLNLAVVVLLLLETSCANLVKFGC